jgi:hypothetical protein
MTIAPNISFTFVHCVRYILYKQRYIHIQETVLLLKLSHSAHYRASCLYFKHDISETAFCLRLQMDPLDRGSLCLRNVVWLAKNVALHSSGFCFRPFLLHPTSSPRKCQASCLQLYVPPPQDPRSAVCVFPEVQGSVPLASFVTVITMVTIVIVQSAAS